MNQSSLLDVRCDKAARRLFALRETGLLDSTAERDFDTVVLLVQRILGCKIALVSLVDEKRQWFKAKCGLEASETPIEQSFCARAVAEDDVLIVRDAAHDPRYAKNPLVTGVPFIRFYAGVPVHVKDHETGEPIAIGTLCAIDDRPRDIRPNDLKNLRALAEIVESSIRARSLAEKATKLAEERLQHVSQLDREQRQFRQAERMANIGSWRLNLCDLTTEWSDQVFAIHGLTRGASIPLEDAMQFYPLSARPGVLAALENTIKTGEPLEFETDFMTADGVAKRVHCMGELETLESRPLAIVGVFQDVTAQYRMEQALRHSASIDDLTQIANRAGCNEAIEARLAVSMDCGTPLALLLIDLDGFKTVNDRCGHQAGDALLQLIGARLQASYLADCFVGRLGGDEFVVVVSGEHDCAELNELVRRLLADLRHMVHCEGGSVAVSGTIGICWRDAGVTTRSELLKRADVALYEAKHERRGAAKIYGAEGIITVADAEPRGAGLRLVSG